MTPATLSECYTALQHMIAWRKSILDAMLLTDNYEQITYWTSSVRDAEVALAEVKREMAK